jgi:DegV family protein with EDD domain
MPPVAVVTDSTSYLPQETLEHHRLQVVPLYVVFGGDRTVPETEITDYPAFFEELRAAESLPTTSQPSVGDFAAVYEPLLAAGSDVVSIHISGGLSGTPEAARQAAEALERDGKGGERVRVVDSTTAAGGLGLLTLVAARAAEAGATLDEIEQRVVAARAELKMWFAIDTLEFLRRGGRIGAASAWIGSTLRVKPILTVENEMTPVERVRTSGRMFERMVEYARQRHDSGADAWAVQHIDASDDAERLVQRCREVFGCEPVVVSEIGPVLSAHTGPGLLGVGSIPTRYLNAA